MWSSIHHALHAGCLRSASATALMTMSLNETVYWSPRAFRAWRASYARSMSISLVRKKCGIGPMDWLRRLAIVLRIWVSGTSRKPAAGSGSEG